MTTIFKDLYKSTLLKPVFLILLVIALLLAPASSFAEGDENPATDSCSTPTVEQADPTNQSGGFEVEISAPSGDFDNPAAFDQDLSLNSIDSGTDFSIEIKSDNTSGTDNNTPALETPAPAPLDAPPAPAESTAAGNSYTAEITSERVIGTGKQDTSFTVSFTEVGEYTPLGSVQLTLPDGFSDVDLVEGSVQASDGKSWTGGVVGLVLSMWAENEESFLRQGESVDATFSATTPTESGIYTFETKAWTDAATDFNDIGTTPNNMAAGYSHPTVGVFEINSPVQISTVDELEHLSSLTNADDLAKDYEQTADIDFLTEYTKNEDGQWPGWDEGKGWTPIGTSSNKFTGIYDGGGFTISNLYINRSNTNYIGLFGDLGSGAVVKNVNLVAVDVTGNNYVGGLAGYNRSGSTIKNSYANGAVSGHAWEVSWHALEVGGLVGGNQGTIEKSHANGIVTGRNKVGGLVGYNSDNGTIENSYAIGEVSGQFNYVGGLVGENNGTVHYSYASGDVEGTGECIGGLIGRSFNGTINNSYATGDVRGGDQVGGLVGYNSRSQNSPEGTGTINNSYATGNVTGGDQVGGLVGLNSVEGQHGFVNNSYATGTVSGDSNNVGGLVGDNSYGTVTNSYATGNVTGSDFVGGLVGANLWGMITNSYATGLVNGTLAYVGGLVGDNGSPTYPGVITNSYWNTETAGVGKGIGGEVDGDVEGKTTAEIQTIDFHQTTLGWNITGQDGFYPKLGWEVNWSANTWYMGTPPTPGGGFGSFINLDFTDDLPIQTVANLTTITGTGSALITPGIITVGSWSDLYQASAAYRTALLFLESNRDVLSQAERTLIEVELAIARAALLAMEARLLAASGLPYNLTALEAAYAAALAVFDANQSFLSANQLAAANQLLSAIAGVITALQ